MSLTKSVYLTDAQEAYARELVVQGRYAGLSAVVLQGLDVLKEQSKTTDALSKLLAERQTSTFIPLDESERRTQDMLLRKKAERGL